MARIYFDTNVFSNLQNNSAGSFQLLNNYIELYKSNLSFFFSHAHIRDKKNDKTNFKFQDFVFMEKIVGDNYISYHGLKKYATFYLATPKMVFDDEELGDENDILIDFWEPKETDEPLFGALKLLIKNLFSTVTIPADSGFESLSDKDKELIKKMVPFEESGEINLGKLLIHVTNFQYHLLTDGETYKELRSFIDKSVNAGEIRNCRRRF